MRSRTRTILRLALVVVVGLALVVGGVGTASASRTRPALPTHINLANGFQPEGIAISPRGIGYFGSLATGDIYAANLDTGRGRIIARGDGTPATGLKYRDGLLYVSGAGSGTARVVSTRTGRTLRTYRLTTNPSFINDVVLAGGYAWFTDSQQAQFYRVPLARHGRPAPASSVRTVPLRGQWEQSATGFNANGISTTPDHRALLIVQSGTGFLFRVNPRTGVAIRVDLGATLLTNGDGLLRRGRVLYAVQNQQNQVAVVRLNRAGTRGTLLRTLTSPDFSVPTTVAAYRGGLYLPNARFGTTPTPTTPYWVTRIPR